MKTKRRKKKHQPHPMHFVYLVILFIGFYMVTTSFGSPVNENEPVIIDFETKSNGYDGHLITQKKIQSYEVTDKSVTFSSDDIKYVDYLNNVAKVTTNSGEVYYLQKNDISPITATIIVKDDNLTTKDEYLRLKHEQESNQFSIFWFLAGILCFFIVMVIVAIEDESASKKA